MNIILKLFTLDNENMIHCKVSFITGYKGGLLIGHIR